MVNASHYRYSVQWSARDNEYVGSVAEFPSLSWLDADEMSAFAGIKQLTSDVVIEMLETGDVPPTPLSERDYSGKFIVRIPPELHKKLATEAAENSVSLNRLISNRLAQSA